MPPSTRTPPKSQVQVLHAVKFAGVDGGPAGPSTTEIHDWLEGKIRERDPDAKPRKMGDTFKLLATCHRYDWLDKLVVSERIGGDGANLDWHFNTAGQEALDRGLAKIAAEEANNQEEPVTPTTTTEPPASTPAWSAADQQRADAATADAAATEEPVIGAPPAEDDDEHSEALRELDEGAAEAAAGDDDVEPIESDPDESGEDERPAPVGTTDDDADVAGQLTLLVVPKGKRERPVTFTLKVKSRERDFGSRRELLIDEVVDISGKVQVYKIDTERTKDGDLVKVAHARIIDCDLLDDVD